jgi:hypothetical protein
LNGIEIVPGIAGVLRPVRILAGARSAYDSREQLWTADRYFLGGRLLVRANAVSGTPEPDLFRCERYGKFTYSIPVADGMYDRTLRFAESNFGVDNFGMPGYQGGGAGSRLFDLYCNGTTLMKEFDILKSAGVPNTAAQRTFRGLRPNAQGKLVLSFVPQRDYATVRAIEVADEGMLTPPPICPQLAVAELSWTTPQETPALHGVPRAAVPARIIFQPACNGFRSRRSAPEFPTSRRAPPDSIPGRLCL